MSKPEPFDIDANPDDANWLHQGPPKYKGEDEEERQPESKDDEEDSDDE